jgi:hypothetical protein
MFSEFHFNTLAFNAQCLLVHLFTAMLGICNVVKCSFAPLQERVDAYTVAIKFVGTLAQRYVNSFTLVNYSIQSVSLIVILAIFIKQTRMRLWKGRKIKIFNGQEHEEIEKIRITRKKPAKKATSDSISKNDDIAIVKQTDQSTNIITQLLCIGAMRCDEKAQSILKNTRQEFGINYRSGVSDQKIRNNMIETIKRIPPEDLKFGYGIHNREFEDVDFVDNVRF